MHASINDCLLRKRNNFDFIRLVASIAVIFAHAFPLTGSGEDPLAKLSNYHFGLGGLAVTTFFVISGFLITRSFERTKTLKDYFTARALRIYPALFVVIVLSALILGPIFTTHSWSAYFSDIKTYKYFTNIFALRIQNSLPGVFHSNNFPDFINGSLWSLPVEMLCYVLVAVVGLIVKGRLKFGLSLGVFVSVYLYFHPEMVNKPQYYQNIFYFFSGGCFYMLRHKIRMNYITAGLMLLIFIGSIKIPGIILNMVVSGISFTYLVLFIGFIKNSPVEHVTKYGDFSYGLYIWAFPVQQILSLKFSDWNAYENFAVSTMITFLLAVLSWHLIEKRALSYKSTFQQRAPVVLKTWDNTVIEETVSV
jgi:peptidoglycan/LPS O-acetylase OafA/YrhL